MATTAADQRPNYGIRTSVWLMLAVASVVAMAEVSRLISDVLDASGHSHDIGQVVGPLAPLYGGTWKEWLGSDVNPAPLIAAHVVLDAIFYVSYFVLGRRLFRNSTTPRILLTLVLAAEIVESLLLVLAIIGLDIGAAGNTTAVPAVLAFASACAPAVSVIKWIFVLLTVLSAIASPAVRRSIAATWLVHWRPVYIQRLSLIVVLALIAMSVIPNDGISDQFPDAVRTWSDFGLTDWKDLVVGLAGLAVLAVVLRVIGRQAGSIPSSGTANRWVAYAWWVAAPATVFAAWLVLVWVGQRELVDGTIVWIFTAGVLVFPLASLILEWQWPRGVIFAVVNWIRVRFGAKPLPAPVPELHSIAEPPDVESVRRAGDILSALAVASGGLGLLRAYIAPAMLTLYPTPGAAVGPQVAYWLFALLGFAGAALSIAIFVRRRPAPLDEAAPPVATEPKPGIRSTVATAIRPITEPDPDTQDPLWLRVTSIALFAAAGVTVIVFMIYPIGMSTGLGVVGSVYVILAIWATLVASVVHWLSGHPPLRIFSVFGLRANPILVVLIAVPLVLSQIGGTPLLHAVQLDADAAAPVRRTLDQAFLSWYGASGACARDVAWSSSAPKETVTARPLVIVAAEGGGIRAATWTVDVMSELQDGSDCSRAATLLSSGVSGGSVGLAMFHGNDGAQARAAVKGLSGPSGLAAAVSGALVGDTLAGATGVRIPSFGDPDGDGVNGWGWQDRVGLMQSVARGVDAHLSDPWNASGEQPTGFAIFNSTDSEQGCRVLVSQLDLRHSTGDRTSCRGNTGRVPASIDLQDQFPAGCPLQMNWASAAMISARFPVISPAGRIAQGTMLDPAACHGVTDMQLIDGGYAESTGLGTLADLAPDLARVVREHNATVAADHTDYVVPIVLYLQNSSGAFVTSDPSKVSAELSVPFAGLGAGKLQTSASSWLQRISGAIGDVCGESDAPCQGVVTAMRASSPGGVAVAAPTSRPSVEAPLGWELSDLSRARLHDEVVIGTCSERPTALDYGTLKDLMTLVDAAPSNCRDLLGSVSDN